MFLEKGVCRFVIYLFLLKFEKLVGDVDCGIGRGRRIKIRFFRNVMFFLELGFRLYINLRLFLIII